MASSQKTSLGLNQWAGSDRPVREDFNNDNAIINEEIETKANKPTSQNFTLTAAGWSGTGPYTQSVSVANVTANSNGFSSLAQSATAAQAEAFREGLVRSSGQGNGTLSFAADGDMPAVNIPMTIVIVG